MSRQYFDDLPIEPLCISNSAVSFSTSELALFPNVSQIAIPTLDVRPGKTWRLTASGLLTTPTTGTMAITPRWGTTTSGVTFGISGLQTYVASQTNVPWYLDGILMCRTVGLFGVNSTFMATVRFHSLGTVATAGSGFTIVAGGTSATGDPTLGGFFIGITFSVTAASMTPQIVLLQSLN